MKRKISTNGCKVTWMFRLSLVNDETFWTAHNNGAGQGHNRPIVIWSRHIADHAWWRPPLHVYNKKLIRRWDSQTWLDDIGGDMPDSTVWPPLPVYLATLGESHSHTPVSEICSEVVIPLDDLRDFWWVSCRMARLQLVQNIPEKLNPLSRVHARHRRQPDLPCH